MSLEWTGVLVGRMHNKKITYKQLGNKLGVTKAYVSMVLNGKRRPTNARERFENALEELIAQQKEDNNYGNKNNRNA